MIKIREIIVNALSNVSGLTNINKVADGISNEDILEELERYRFTHSGLLLGNINYSVERLSYAYNKETYECDIFFIYKTKNVGREEFENNCTLIINQMTDNTLGLSNSLQTKFENVKITEEYNDRVKYRILKYIITSYGELTETKADTTFTTIPFISRDGNTTNVLVNIYQT